MKTGYLFPNVISVEPHGGQLLNVESLSNGSRPWLEISCDSTQRSPEILFDFGNKTTGYLFVDIRGSSGDTLCFEYGPRLDAMFFTHHVPLPTETQIWIDARHVAMRYMRMTLVSTATLPTRSWVQLGRVGVKFSAYPFVYRGQFASGDEQLDRIWLSGAYTNQLCVQRADASCAYHPMLPQASRDFLTKWNSAYSPYIIMDGPRRDMESWIGDVRTEALTHYAAFGDYDIAKATLSLFADLQAASGKLPASSASRQDFTEYNLWWIISLWECYLHSGDAAFLQRMYLTYRNCLDWLQLGIDHRGFIHSNRTWMWTIARDPYTISSQCILVQTLRCAAEIERALDNEPTARALDAQADHTQATINANFWDEARGIYVDLIDLIVPQDPVFLDTNAYAIVFGIADEKRRGRVLAYLQEQMWTAYGSTTIDIRLSEIRVPESCRHYDGFRVPRDRLDTELPDLIYAHNRQIWPFMTGYEVEARFLAGDTDGAFELIRNCWGNMIAQDPGTCWEMVDADTGTFPLRGFVPGAKGDVLNSASHGWSGWVTYILSRYVLGIWPIDPGYTTALFRPNPGHLQQVSGRVPTPLGAIAVSIAQHPDHAELTVVAPAGVELVYDFRDLWPRHARITVNGIEFFSPHRVVAEPQYHVATKSGGLHLTE